MGIKKIIQERLKGYEGLTTKTINLILENSNLDRIKLNNELEKIEQFFKDKKIDYDNLESTPRFKDKRRFYRSKRCSTFRRQVKNK